ncbi:MAG: hypothetical protein R3F34_18485 [Planctomycetota bacterium]
MTPLLAQQGFDARELIQLALLALFFFGPVVLRILMKVLKVQGASANEQQRPGGAPPARRAARERSQAEVEGKDLWRQLMELERTDTAVEVEEAEEVEVAPPRRPADPLHDPDVAAAQRAAQRAARRAARAERRVRDVLEPLPPEDVVESGAPPATAPVAPRPVARGGFASLPSARTGAGIASSSALDAPSMPSDVQRAAPIRSRLGTDRDSLRRAVVLSEVLGRPVALRRSGAGGVSFEA